MEPLDSFLQRKVQKKKNNPSFPNPPNILIMKFSQAAVLACISCTLAAPTAPPTNNKAMTGTSAESSGLLGGLLGGGGKKGNKTMKSMKATRATADGLGDLLGGEKGNGTMKSMKSTRATIDTAGGLGDLLGGLLGGGKKSNSTKPASGKKVMAGPGAASPDVAEILKAMGSSGGKANNLTKPTPVQGASTGGMLSSLGIDPAAILKQYGELQKAGALDALRGANGGSIPGLPLGAPAAAAPGVAPVGGVSGLGGLGPASGAALVPVVGQ